MTKDVEAKHSKEVGLGWFVTGLFLVGEMAGGGIVALPGAFMQSDFYVGFVFVILMSIMAAYTGYVLGLTWVTLQKRWPEYREHCRKPYPEIGARAMGKVAKSAASVCIDVTQFGVSVVFLLLSAKNIHDFLEALLSKEFSFCYVILIVGVCVLPLTFLKSPQDFWWAVVVAMVTTTVAVILIMVGSAIDIGVCHAHRDVNHKFVAINYLLSFGTILFSFGGHSCFPTIIHDMRKPYQFHRSSIFAFSVIAVLYTSVSVMGFAAYGNSLQDSIINSIQYTGIQQAINLLITLHCLLTLTIVLNPLNQEAEEIFGVPQEWTWKRVLLRTGVLAAVIFVAESLPSFGPLLDFVGSTTISATSLVFPCLFYLYIAAAEEMSIEYDGKLSIELAKRPSFREVIRRSPKIRLTICAVIILVGVLGGAAGTYSAVRELATTKFAMPCYVRPFMSSSDVPSSSHTNCCGRYQNISRYGDTSICNPFRDFYNQY